MLLLTTTRTYSQKPLYRQKLHVTAIKWIITGANTLTGGVIAAQN